MRVGVSFFKFASWLLAGIIGLFGFAGCWEFGMAEYGTPSARYTVKGAVHNEADGNPIAGIRVGYSPEVWDDALYGPPSVYSSESDAFVITNTSGDFTLSAAMHPLGRYDRILPVYIEDIDGDENGLFAPKMVQVDFSNASYSGKSGNWYSGECTVTVTINLTEIDQ